MGARRVGAVSARGGDGEAHRTLRRQARRPGEAPRARRRRRESQYPAPDGPGGLGQVHDPRDAGERDAEQDGRAGRSDTLRARSHPVHERRERPRVRPRPVRPAAHLRFDGTLRRHQTRPPEALRRAQAALQHIRRPPKHAARSRRCAPAVPRPRRAVRQGYLHPGRAGSGRHARVRAPRLSPRRSSFGGTGHRILRRVQAPERREGYAQ